MAKPTEYRENEFHSRSMCLTMFEPTSSSGPKPNSSPTFSLIHSTVPCASSTADTVGDAESTPRRNSALPASSTGMPNGTALSGSGLASQALDLVGRDRIPEVEALRESAAQAGQRRQLLLVLDALGDRAEVQRPRERDDRLHDLAVVVAPTQAPHERPVDLHRVD